MTRDRGAKEGRGRVPSKDAPISVVVGDGHTLTRLGIATFLEGEDDLRLVGETGEEGELLRLARDRRPDLVILDLNLDGGPDKFGICYKLKALADPPRVLVHTSYDFTDEAAACLLAAEAHLRKDACCAVFAATVRRVVDGWRRAPERAGRVQDALRADVGPVDRLTRKEREVAAMMLEHRSNSEMALALHVSLPTVKTHVRSILRKLGVKNRRELFKPQAL